MNWLILLYFIELGYSPFYNSLNVLPNTYEQILNENVYYIEFDAEVILLDYIFIGGAFKTFIQPNNRDYDFFPIENNYLFKTGLRYKKLEAGFRHLYIHPGLSSGVVSQGQSFGAYEEFYIRISSEF